MNPGPPPKGREQALGLSLLFFTVGVAALVTRARGARLGAGGEHGRHGAALHAGVLLHDRDVAHRVYDGVDLTLRGLGVRDLAAAEADRDLDLVPLFQEAARVLDLEGDVVVVGLRAEFDLLELDLRDKK